MIFFQVNCFFYARSTVTNFVEMSRCKQSPRYLLMGPWIHGIDTCEATVSGEVDFGFEARLDYYYLEQVFMISSLV